eukprot:4325232-Alexandrium_andersonii.AAC.1
MPLVSLVGRGLWGSEPSAEEASLNWPEPPEDVAAWLRDRCGDVEGCPLRAIFERLAGNLNGEELPTPGPCAGPLPPGPSAYSDGS